MGPKPADACTNSCQCKLCSTQLYAEKLLYCFVGWHCYTGVRKTKVERSYNPGQYYIKLYNNKRKI